MSKELVGQISTSLPAPRPVPGSPVPIDPTKLLLTDIKGEKGDKGDPGDPGSADPEVVEEIVEEYLDANPVGLYVEIFNQVSPAAVWEIIHTLPFQPAVTIIDSAGTRVETEIRYISSTHIRSIASAAFSGRAYLS